LTPQQSTHPATSKESNEQVRSQDLRLLKDFEKNRLANETACLWVRDFNTKCSNQRPKKRRKSKGNDLSQHGNMFDLSLN